MEPTTQTPPEFVAIVIPTADYQAFALFFGAANLGAVPGNSLAVAEKYIELSKRVNAPQGVNIQDDAPAAVPDNVTPITAPTIIADESDE